MKSLHCTEELDPSLGCPSSTSSDSASGQDSPSSSESSSPEGPAKPKAKSSKASTVRARKARFTTELEIIAAIDAKQAFISKLRLKAGQLDLKASEIFDAIQDWPETELKWKQKDRGDDLRDKANHTRSRADRIQNNYLSRLKGRLAVFRTGQLPTLDNNDSSVPK